MISAERNGPETWFEHRRQQRRLRSARRKADQIARTDIVREQKRVKKEKGREENQLTINIAAILAANIAPQGVQIGEIGGPGKIERLALAIVKTKLMVAILCPDFKTETRETTSFFGLTTTEFVFPSEIGTGIGFVGQRLLSSLPLVEAISRSLNHDLDLVVVYQASSEPIVTPDKRPLVHQSAANLRQLVNSRQLPFRTTVSVIDDDLFLPQAQSMIPEIKSNLDPLTLQAIAIRRKNIIRMRTGKDFVDPETSRRETILDIAIHQLTEQDIQEKILNGSPFVHLTADTPTFARFYKHPFIALCRGNNLRYQGDE